jgi:hypothetical protein
MAGLVPAVYVLMSAVFFDMRMFADMRTPFFERLRGRDSLNVH